jgi:hypothetical protein
MLTYCLPRMLLLLLLQADSATQKQVDLVRMTENTKRNLEQEVAAYRCGIITRVCTRHGSVVTYAHTIVALIAAWWTRAMLCVMVLGLPCCVSCVLTVHQ